MMYSFMYDSFIHAFIRAALGDLRAYCTVLCYDSPAARGEGRRWEGGRVLLSGALSQRGKEPVATSSLRALRLGSVAFSIGAMLV